MKHYEFRLVIHEGNDEFWESILDKTGCDEVKDAIVDMLNDRGFFTDTNCELDLVQFKDDLQEPPK